MIELRTGLPGNGKTLSIVQELAAMQAKWDKGDEAARPVFVHNVRDLALPHSPLPLNTIQHKGGIEQNIPDWSQVPDGSLIIIDEGQDLFPPRSSQSMAPPHVAWLNTHRHRGVDILISTQHPKLVDASLRALVGKHKHYRRVFGMQRSIVYEWDGCSDSLAGMKDATKTFWNFPKDAFKWYKSAEVHTKQKFKLPFWVVIPFVGLLLGVFFVPRAYSVLSNGIKGKSLSAHAEQPAQPHLPQAVAMGEKGGALAPTASPQAVALPAVAPSPPQYVGCIASASKCQCLTSAGQVVDEPHQCRESAEHVGYLVALATGSAGSTAAPATVDVFGKGSAVASSPAGPDSGSPVSQNGVGIRQPEGVRQPEGLRQPEGVRQSLSGRPEK